MHEMRMAKGKIVAVYTDCDGNEYRIVNGEKRYFSGPAGDERRNDWCPLCGGNHEIGNGTPGYSCG